MNKAPHRSVLYLCVLFCLGFGLFFVELSPVFAQDIIIDGNVAGPIYGNSTTPDGTGMPTTDNATGNSVTVNSGTVTGGAVFGGRADSPLIVTATNNTVTISGSPTFTR